MSWCNGLPEISGKLSAYYEQKEREKRWRTKNIKLRPVTEFASNTDFEQSPANSSDVNSGQSRVYPGNINAENFAMRSKNLHRKLSRTSTKLQHQTIMNPEEIRSAHYNCLTEVRSEHSTGAKVHSEQTMGPEEVHCRSFLCTNKGNIEESMLPIKTRYVKSLDPIKVSYLQSSGLDIVHTEQPDNVYSEPHEVHSTERHVGEQQLAMHSHKVQTELFPEQSNAESTTKRKRVESECSTLQAKVSRVELTPAYQREIHSKQSIASNWRYVPHESDSESYSEPETAIEAGSEKQSDSETESHPVEETEANDNKLQECSNFLIGAVLISVLVAAITVLIKLLTM